MKRKYLGVCDNWKLCPTIIIRCQESFPKHTLYLKERKKNFIEFSCPICNYCYDMKWKTWNEWGIKLFWISFYMEISPGIFIWEGLYTGPIFPIFPRFPWVSLGIPQNVMSYLYFVFSEATKLHVDKSPLFLIQWWHYGRKTEKTEKGTR